MNQEDITKVVTFLTWSKEIKDLCIKLANTEFNNNPLWVTLAPGGSSLSGLEHKVAPPIEPSWKQENTAPIQQELIKTEPQPKKKKIISRKFRWTVQERQLLFEDFDKNGRPSKQRRTELAQLFNCSANAIQVQFDTTYKYSRGIATNIPTKDKSE